MYTTHTALGGFPSWSLCSSSASFLSLSLRLHWPHWPHPEICHIASAHCRQRNSQDESIETSKCMRWEGITASAPAWMHSIRQANSMLPPTALKVQMARSHQAEMKSIVTRSRALSSTAILEQQYSIYEQASHVREQSLTWGSCCQSVPVLACVQSRRQRHQRQQPG